MSSFPPPGYRGFLQPCRVNTTLKVCRKVCLASRAHLLQGLEHFLDGVPDVLVVRGALEGFDSALPDAGRGVRHLFRQQFLGFGELSLDLVMVTAARSGGGGWGARIRDRG